MQHYYWNGVNAESGKYLTRPRTWAGLVRCVLSTLGPVLRGRCEICQPSVDVLNERRGEPPPGVDLLDLESAGWGVIFHRDAPRLLEIAVTELLRYRESLAGERFRIFKGRQGYWPGDTRDQWLTRQGVGPGIGDPDQVPWYLLIVGGPVDIPYRFQFNLSMRYAVGRIAFDNLEGYRQYGINVIEGEGRSPRKRRLTFFGVENSDDPATQGSLQDLLMPILKHFEGFELQGWTIESILGRMATKKALVNLFQSDHVPTVLMTTSHGMAPGESGNLLERVGALLCDEWPGPKQWRETIPPEYYFSSIDVPDDGDLRGLVAILFGCYTLGMPEHDSFCCTPPRRLGPQDMIAPLPMGLLARRKGALAVIGHVDRAWDFSYQWGSAGKQPLTFRAVVDGLLRGHPVGAAARFLIERYSDIAIELKDILTDSILGKEIDEGRLVELWVAEADARSYAVLGDPAARTGI